MLEGKLLTVREASQMLDLSEREITELAESGQLPAYKVGGQYLRFKREQIELFRKKIKKSARGTGSYVRSSIRERLSDFIYFNDFYIFSIFVILWMLFIIYTG